MVICRSPSFGRSTTARSDRPISRWISWVRPDTLPVEDSRLRAGQGGARQHGVFRRHPAPPLAAQPRRRLVLERGRAQHMGVAEAHEARALGVARHPALEAHLAHFVGGAFGRTHVNCLFLCLPGRFSGRLAAAQRALFSLLPSGEGPGMRAAAGAAGPSGAARRIQLHRRTPHPALRATFSLNPREKGVPALTRPPASLGSAAANTGTRWTCPPTLRSTRRGPSRG